MDTIERERQDVKKARFKGQRPEREGGRVICMWLTTHGKGASLLFSRFFGELVKKLLVIHRIKQELKNEPFHGQTTRSERCMWRSNSAPRNHNTKAKCTLHCGDQNKTFPREGGRPITIPVRVRPLGGGRQASVAEIDGQPNILASQRSTDKTLKGGKVVNVLTVGLS